MYGRDGDLAKLNKDRNNTTLGMNTRKAANAAYEKIVDQLQDKTLMAMRMRLIKASQAGDELEIHKITLQMKAHQGQELESGLMHE